MNGVHSSPVFDPLKYPLANFIRLYAVVSLSKKALIFKDFENLYFPLFYTVSYIASNSIPLSSTRL